MKASHYLSYFFGGAFLINCIPHLVMGVTGQSFQSPFSSPPGEGLSPAMVNVLWGFSNLVIAYFLLCRVGHFELRQNKHIAPAALGAFLISLLLAHSFARFHGGL